MTARLPVFRWPPAKRAGTLVAPFPFRSHTTIHALSHPKRRRLRYRSGSESMSESLTWRPAVTAISESSVCQTRRFAQSRARIEAAIRNSGFELAIPENHSTSHPPTCGSEGSSFDLPIAVAILASIGVIQREIDDTLTHRRTSHPGRPHEAGPGRAVGRNVLLGTSGFPT